MSKNFEVVLNYAGVGELLKSPQMQVMLRERATPIASFTKGKLEVYVAGTRAVAKVGGDNGKNSLLKAVR